MKACEVGGGEADVLIAGGGTAEHSYAMYTKQIGSVGCPHWVRSQKELASAKKSFDEGNIKVVVTTMIGADSGGDEAKNVKLVRDATADDSDSYCISGA